MSENLTASLFYENPSLRRHGATITQRYRLNVVDGTRVPAYLMYQAEGLPDIGDEYGVYDSAGVKTTVCFRADLSVSGELQGEVRAIYVPLYCADISVDPVVDGEEVHWIATVVYETSAEIYTTPDVAGNSMARAKVCDAAYAVDTIGDIRSSLSTDSTPGVRLVNAAGDPFVPEVQDDFYSYTIDIARTYTESMYSAAKPIEVQGCINSAEVTINGMTVAAGNAKIITSAPQQIRAYDAGGQEISVYTVHYHIEVTPDGHFARRLNAGLNYLDTADNFDTKRPFTDEEGNLLTEPQALGTDGTALSAEASPVVYGAQTARAIDFDSLLLPPEMVDPAYMGGFRTYLRALGD